MSLFSRLFRKAPPQSAAPAPSVQPAPSEKNEKSPLKPGAADRALAAAADERALRAAIDARDGQAVARLVVAGASTKVRQAAAEAIEDPDVLRQLIREVRGGNDKNVYKTLTSKRDALLQQVRTLEQRRASINEISGGLERLSKRPHDALFSSRLEQLESRWSAVAEHADPELRGTVQQWVDRSRQTVAEHLRQMAEQASRELAAASAVAEAAAEAARQRDEQAQAAAAATAEQARLAEEQKRALTEKQHAEQQAVREIGDLIRKARGALSGGSTSRAAGVRRAIEEKLAGSPSLPDHLASQLQQLDKQLDALKDWKSFSVAPKRAELIEEMELLAGTTLEPLALADRIKSLQDEWRTLSKGAGEDLEGDWQRFQEAAQRAYQPCREYFAAQALVREENLRRRDALLTRLTAFEAGYDWQQPDWRAVIKTLREAKDEWRNCSPVDRQAGKPQQEAFEAVTASLQGRLDAEYARNLKQKESLIERSRQLIAGNDSRKSIDAIKELQQQWQAVGPVPREADQRLWGEFRQHCDAVFQKRQQESAAYAAGLEDNKTQALALCERLDQIAALDGAELLAQAGALAELRSAFAAIGEFPRADTRDIRNRYDQGLERFEQSMARQQARDAERGWDDLFDAANLVRAYRLGLARNVGPEQLHSLKDAADTYIASVARWPKGGLDALKNALALEGSTDLAANEATLRMLCIRAEILTDTPTPPEDQALRREYLLQRLAQSMGQGLRVDETRLDAMAIEWVSVGPVEDLAYGPLVQRFRRCRVITPKPENSRK